VSVGRGAVMYNELPEEVTVYLVVVPNTTRPIAAGIGGGKAMNRTNLVAAMLATALFTTAAPVVRSVDGAPQPVTRLITLGTQGGPRGSADRSQPSNVLIVNGKPYLIDAGNGVAEQLLRAGVPFTSIRQIFITHNHDDHNADWGTLMGRAWTSGQYEPMTVYGPRGTESMRKGFLAGSRRRGGQDVDSDSHRSWNTS
jgi:Metallo-beta-lactamase superfamily